MNHPNIGQFKDFFSQSTLEETALELLPELNELCVTRLIENQTFNFDGFTIRFVDDEQNYQSNQKSQILITIYVDFDGPHTNISRDEVLNKGMGFNLIVDRSTGDIINNYTHLPASIFLKPNIYKNLKKWVFSTLFDHLVDKEEDIDENGDLISKNKKTEDVTLISEPDSESVEKTDIRVGDKKEKVNYSKLKNLKYKEIIDTVKDMARKRGTTFVELRACGSHVIWKFDTKKSPLPNNGDQIVPIGTVRAFLKQLSIRPIEFLKAQG